MERADVLIQAGHEGLTSGQTGASGPLGPEIEWTPVVADEATRILRGAGVSVIRADANFDLPARTYSVLAAVFLHFDGGEPACATTASVGYPVDDDLSSHLAADADMARSWKQFYSQFWTFGFMEDNFTANLRRYYGFRPTTAERGMTLIEFGEVSCLRQAQWLKPRLKYLGQLLAHFLSNRIGKGEVPLPSIRPDLLHVEMPDSGATIPLNTSVRFAGTADRQVAVVHALAGPGGPFELARVRPDAAGHWAFDQSFGTEGRNRPFTFRAENAAGDVLQEVGLHFTVAAEDLGTRLTVGHWRAVYAGLEMSGSSVPERGSVNDSLAAFDLKVEPLGDRVDLGGVPFIRGKISWFGGATDTGVTPAETGALTGEILRQLDADDFYCAMRWNYQPNGPAFWRNRPMLVVNPVTEAAVVVRAIDWGPNPSTGRTLDLSPAALHALGLATDASALCAFAKPDTAIGPVSR